MNTQGRSRGFSGNKFADRYVNWLSMSVEGHHLVSIGKSKQIGATVHEGLRTWNGTSVNI